MRKIILSFSVILICFPGFGQKLIKSKIDSLISKTPFSVRIGFQSGHVFPTNEFISGDNLAHDTIDSYNSINLLFLKQTKGDRLWEQLYGYPVYGIGYYSAFFDETNELGVPFAIYGIFSAPFVRFHKLSFNYEMGLGIATEWNNFNPVTNPKNIAISAEQSTYIEAGLNLEYQFGERNFLSAGYGLYHFSNGKLKMPNRGLNTGALKLSFRYQLNKDTRTFIKRKVPEFKKYFEWDISFYGGAKNVTYTGNDVDIITKYNGIYFPVMGINNAISRVIDYKSKIGLGFSVGYNGAINSQIAVEEGELDEVDLPFRNHITFSVFPSYELVVDKLAFVVQPGFYIYRKKSPELTPVFYQRLGIKYHFYKYYFLGINIRAFQFNESDFIEWNIGRTIKW